MKLSDEKRLDAPREEVWRGLNDPEILKQSIPGCESLEQISDTEFEAEVRAKVGPVKAKFKGSVKLTDLNPPESYRISGEGKGGAAGFAKGGAVVTLTEDGDGTILKYDVDADVGGKLAQIGGRLLEGTSKKLAGEFFDNFETALKGEGGADASGDDAGDTADAEPAADAAPADPAPSQPAPAERTVSESGTGISKILVVIGAVLVIGALALTIMQ
ncbi:MAG: carbon monoxide dehydrogenase subunit G [Rhodospirillales bacterium]|nr:carbon monoxide dehydrogenase subunit G [Rhodospirillales bacterium]